MVAVIVAVAVVAIAAAVLLAQRSRRSIIEDASGGPRVAGAADVVIDLRNDADPATIEDVIPDYDALKAVDVVDALRHLDRDRLEVVRRHELEHKARKTVLTRIDALQDS